MATPDGRLDDAAVGLPPPSQFEQEIFTQTNALRVAEGLDELEWNECASAVAVERARAILGLELLVHEPLRVQCGNYGMAGENLSRGAMTSQEVMEQWLGSPLHEQNVMSPYFRILGVGCVAYSFDQPSREAAAGEEVGGMACSQIYEGVAPG